MTASQFYIILQINELYIQAQKNKQKNNQIKVNAKSLEDSPVDQVFAVQAWEPSFGPLTPA